MDKKLDHEFFLKIDEEREQKKRKAYFNGYKNFAHLEEIATKTSLKISVLASKFYADEDFNFYSNAYLKENLMVFAVALEALQKSGIKTIHYLEVGVNKGLSSLAVHLLCEQLGLACKIRGVDPYYEDGYVEGVARTINKKTKEQTLTFLRENNVQFSLVEKTSNAAFLDLIRCDDRFDLIYIDGRHELLFPLVDVGSYINLLIKNGIFLIDDYFWRDVFQIKHLFDLYAEPICESWKIAAFQVHLNPEIF